MFGFLWFLRLFSFLCWYPAAYVGLLYHSFSLRCEQERGEEAGFTSRDGFNPVHESRDFRRGNYDASGEGGEGMRQ